MTSSLVDERPICEEIIQHKSSWALELKEFVNLEYQEYSIFSQAYRSKFRKKSPQEKFMFQKMNEFINSSGKYYVIR
jgi:hypothetical protein